MDDTVLDVDDQVHICPSPCASLPVVCTLLHTADGGAIKQQCMFRFTATHVWASVSTVPNRPADWRCHACSIDALLAIYCPDAAQTSLRFRSFPFRHSCPGAKRECVLGRLSVLCPKRVLCMRSSPFICVVHERAYTSSMACDAGSLALVHQKPKWRSRVLTLLQRRSRRSLALKRSTSKDMSHAANPSSRRMSLDKAQSRKALGSQKALSTHQTLQGNGVADSHQKPTGTAVNPVADVETGQMQHGTAVDGTGDVKRSSNSGVVICICVSCPPFHLPSQWLLQSPSCCQVCGSACAVVLVQSQ